ncbi:MAG: family N-acetyltransferase [Alphaproteobacteria bacterium]|nr:family N-acetyltransferase [Alphaproteobacteria bacterium]
MIDIRPGDLDDPRVLELLGVHLALARAVSPPESTHALDIAGLRGPAILFWSGWESEALVAVGALAELDPGHGEVKSMHVAAAARGCGVGGAMLRHIIAAARASGRTRLSLETGAMDYFAPARALYRRHGFHDCGPFGRYEPDPNSVFMTMTL